MQDLTTIRNLRHELHRSAELSEYEVNTASIIKAHLSRYSSGQIIENLGGNGLISVYRFGKSGPRIIFRCEMDALPIDEAHLHLTYQSTHSGVSHKCGHDGHMAIVAGLAGHLDSAMYQKGEVILLFQPAEENGVGAKRMLEDQRIRGLKPDYVFALHNLPGFEKGQILCKEGTFTAAVCSLIVSLKGLAAHSSTPENGINPSLAMAEITQLAAQLTLNVRTNPDFRLVTPVYYSMGQKAYGISAGEGEMHFTLRAWTSEKLNDLISDFIVSIRDIATNYKLQTSFQTLEEFASTHNNPEAVDIIRQAARRSKLEYQPMQDPFKFGEDFGLFTQHYKGAIFGLGAGEQHPPLHHPDYDFPDLLIEEGIQMFKAITDLLLGD